VGSNSSNYHTSASSIVIPEVVPVVIKLSIIPTGNNDDVPSAVHEIQMYNSYLKHLQGTVVPHFYGAFKLDKRSVVLTILERVGEPLFKGYSVRDTSYRGHICKLYHDLHNAGVVHGHYPSSGSHIRYYSANCSDIPPTTSRRPLCLIDLEAARYVGADDKEGLIAKEKNLVEKNLCAESWVWKLFH